MVNSRSDSIVRNSDGSISIRKSIRKRQNRLGNTKVALRKKSSSKAKIDMKSEVSGGKVILHLPLETVSEANNFEHWTKKHQRHSEQKRIVSLGLKPLRQHISLPCHIKIIRRAPRKLDRWDNLPMSVKYILDACCAIITGDFRPGRADDDERITVSYDQIVSPQYGVSLEISKNLM